MASLLSDAEKAALEAEMVNVADTWERDILVFVSPEKLIVSSNPNFNRFQQNSQNLQNQNPGNVPQSYIIKARVLYNKEQMYPYMNPYVGGSNDEAQLKQRVEEGKVRIKVGPSGYAIMGDAKKIEFDGLAFDCDTVVRPHGLFNSQYYTYNLKRVG